MKLSKLAISALCGLGFLAASGASANAQYYYQQAPRYYPAPQFQPQPYQQQYDDYRPRQRYHQRRVDLGSVCVTSRGECSVGGMVPIGTGCGCRIPNFGKKRGHVQY